MNETTAVYVGIGVLFTVLLVAAVLAWTRAIRRDNTEAAEYQRMRDAFTPGGED